MKTGASNNVGGGKLFCGHTSAYARKKSVTAYAALRPDGQYSLLVINRDQWNGHKFRSRG